MAEVTCFHCKRLIIEIDHYGQRLIGCIECNRWTLPGSRRVVELTEDDIQALRLCPGRSKKETALGGSSCGRFRADQAKKEKPRPESLTGAKVS
jgi:hypothetical protein